MVHSRKVIRFITHHGVWVVFQETMSNCTTKDAALFHRNVSVDQLIHYPPYPHLYPDLYLYLDWVVNIRPGVL